VWKPRFDEPLVVVLDLPKGVRPRSVFRVQIGSFASEEEAEALRDRVSRLVSDPVVVSYNPDRDSYRVRVGQFEKREDATALTDRLLEEGFSELWVAEEAAPASGKARLRIVDSHYYSQTTDLKILRIQPIDPAAILEVDGQPYRGTAEVRILGDSLKVINQLGIEEYLRGVVPNEMGPNSFPELEALKAQAVAARTYIVANRGQFADSGYDICDTPACQVYKGYGTEHPLTDQAVRETAGLIATYQGVPIKALYTSTCGGHTEDGVNVFSDLRVPYLKGVPCYPESSTPVALAGREDLPAVELPTGGTLAAEVGILRVAGVVGDEALRRRYLQEEASPSDVMVWWRRAFGLVGAGNVPTGFRFERGDTLEWTRFLMRTFGWEERARLALDEKDLPYQLPPGGRDEIPPADRRAVAFLLGQGVLNPFPDGTLRLEERPTRGMVLAWIHRIAERYQALGLRRSSFRALEGTRLRIANKSQQQTLPLAPAPLLYRSARGRTHPSAILALAPGDDLTFHLNAAGQVDLILLESSSRGAADDRYSSYAQWEVRLTRQELEDLVRKRFDVGRLADVVPTKRGVSGRVTAIKFLGSRGTFTLSGFRIRTALGLRENLFAIERQVDPGGGIRAFVFSGKGWGHGVGLCQVGAFGMAIRGEPFERILRHYYTGAEIVRAY
jgi:stage II sporulation protein D